LVGALYYSAFTTYLLASHILRWNFSKGLSPLHPQGKGSPQVPPPGSPHTAPFHKRDLGPKYARPINGARLLHKWGLPRAVNRSSRTTINMIEV